MTRRMWIHTGYGILITLTAAAAWLLLGSDLDAKMKTCFLLFLVFTFADVADRLLRETRRTKG